MQFKLTQMKSEIEILQMTNRYLEKEYKKRQVLNVLIPSEDLVNKLLCQLDEMSLNLEHTVKEYVDLSYACFLSGNPSDCHLYWNLQNYFEDEVLTNYAEFYWYVHTVQAALNHREYSIPAISNTINDLERKVNDLQISINIALIDLAERSDNTKDNRGFLTEFNFSPQFTTTDYDFELPPSITGRLLWYLNPETAPLVPGELYQEYNLIFNHLNTAATNVSAKISTVSVHRRWFKPGLFGDKYINLVSNQHFFTHCI